MNEEQYREELARELCCRCWLPGCDWYWASVPVHTACKQIWQLEYRAKWGNRDD